MGKYMNEVITNGQQRGTASMSIANNIMHLAVQP